MRILAVFAVLATVTVLLYAFGFLLSVARSIAIYGPQGVQDSYRQVYDMLNIDAAITGIYVAATLLVAISIYMFVKWIGEILSS